MQDNKNFLGTEPVGKLLLKLSIPTVIAQLINMLYNIVDRIYIGHIPGEGSLALTGVGVCMPIIMIVSAFAALVSSGGAPRASIYMGKQDNKSAENILGNCFILQIIISVILTAILLIWGRDLLLAFGASETPSVMQQIICILRFRYLVRTINPWYECIHHCTGILPHFPWFPS